MVVARAEVGLQPAVERQRHAGRGAIVAESLHAQLGPPEGEAARKQRVNIRVEFFRQQAGQLAGGAHAAEQGGERALEPGVLVEEEAEAAVAPEDLHRILKTLLAREQPHAETLPRAFDPGIGRRVVERTEDHAELGKGRRHEERQHGLAFPAAEVRGDKKGGALRRQRRCQRGRGAQHPAQPALGEKRHGERQQRGFDQPPAAFAADGPVPVRRPVLEGVMKIGEHQLPAAREAEKQQITQSRRQASQQRLRQVRQHPARGFEDDLKHRRRAPRHGGAGGACR